MMMYMATIAKLSKKFQWPSWIMYDHDFRQEAAATGNHDWAKIDPGVYATSFTNQGVASDGWCGTCKTMEHSKDSCPLRPNSATQAQFGKRRAMAAIPTPKRQRVAGSVPHLCRDWNKLEPYMSCSYGESCRFLHVCSKCRQPDHAASKCTSSKPRV